MNYSILEIIYLIVLLGAALGSTVFVLDYIRTASIKNPHARLVLALNIAIAAIIWPSFLRSLGMELPNLWGVVFLISFITVDVCLWYQIILLNRARKDANNKFLLEGVEKNNMDEPH